MLAVTCVGSNRGFSSLWRAKGSSNLLVAGVGQTQQRWLVKPMQAISYLQ